jgi:hypothetical protein
MSPKPPRTPQPPSREDRLAKALRENLARRKALTRVKRERAGPDSPSADPAPPAPAAGDDDASS